MRGMSVWRWGKRWTGQEIVPLPWQMWREGGLRWLVLSCGLGRRFIDTLLVSSSHMHRRLFLDPTSQTSLIYQVYDIPSLPELNRLL